MKKNLLFLAGLFVLSLNGLAQSNLVIFSEDGDAFYAYINGVRQNNSPETNVKVTGLSANVSLRVEFADKALPQLKQAMPLESGFEYAVRLKRNKKKQIKLRYFGQTPIAASPATGATEVPYHTAENTTNYNTATNTNNQAGTPSGNTSVNSSSTTTSVNNGAPANGNVSINVNMSGTGVNMNVTGMDPNANGMNTTTSTTVTNSTSSSTSYSENNNGSYNNSQNNNSYNNTPKHYREQGCSMAMSQANFSNMKKSVEAKPFSDTKMSTAKVATKNACLSAAQIKEICKLFSMDDDKLEYAKYAYDYCMDKANFYQVSEVFSFSTTTDELNKFLEAK